MDLVISGYQFIDIDNTELPYWQDTFKQVSSQKNLKGTILLSAEGINLNLSGATDNIRSMQCFLAEQTPFQGLSFREMHAELAPFKRLSVRIKPEIITMGQPSIKPTQHPTPYVKPQTLHNWYCEGKEMILLDTRNDYEFAFGSFKDALHLNIKQFRQFPAAVQNLPNTLKKQPVVTFCTGGIRCEKAAAYLQQQGYSEVYQLQGGILNYLSQYGQGYFAGECFVFDTRVALDVELAQTNTTHCRTCQMPIKNPTAETFCGLCQGVPRKKDSHYELAL